VNLHRLLFSACAALLAAAFAHSAYADSVIVLNSLSNTISLIDPKTYKETSRVSIGKQPHHMMATPDDDALLIGNTGNNELVFLNRKTGDVTHKIPMLDPYQLAFSPDRKVFVTTALRMDYVDIYTGDDIIKRRDGAKPLARVKTGSIPSHLAFTNDSKFIYVTEQGAASVAVIDVAAQKVVQTIVVGEGPAGIWTSPDDKEIWVGVMGANHVAVIDRASGKVVATVPTGEGAHNIFPRGDGKHILVSNRVANTISMIDWKARKVVDTYPVKGGPDCLEIVPGSNEMWVTARWAKKVVVIDLATKEVKASIPVGRSPHGIYYHAHAARK
jgi:YVTN family beta-propeller protein